MIRNEAIRFKLLRGGADYAFLYPVSDPTLRCRASGEIKLSLQGDFRPAAYDARGRELPVDWLTDEIQPILILDGVPHTLGVLSPASMEQKTDETRNYISLEAYDRSWIVRDTKTENILHIAKGTLYTDAVEQLLTGAGINTIVKTPSAAVLAEDREDWDVGTSYLKIANELLKEINYKQLWFNADGVAMLQPKSEPRAENAQHIFTSRPADVRDPRALGLIRMKRDVSAKTDVYNAPNVFVCTCANPDKSGVMIARAENTNPQSPLSVMRRGRRIVDFENVNNIASQSELQAYTDQKRNKSMITGEVISCQTLLSPGFGVEDVTAVQTDTLTAACVETSWEMELRVGGLMRHELERVVYNLD